MRHPAVIVVVALALSSGPAAAHETLHEVSRGQAVAVRVYESDGEPVAGAAWEAYAPGEPERPWQTGRTDRAGWLAFVPGPTGRWRIRVMEATGHGLDLGVEVGPAVHAAGATAGPAATPPPASAAGTGAGATLALRTLLGAAIIALVFAAAFLAWRRKGPPPPPRP